jgi:hypothetical protein
MMFKTFMTVPGSKLPDTNPISRRMWGRQVFAQRTLIRS